VKPKPLLGDFYTVFMTFYLKLEGVGIIPCLEGGNETASYYCCFGWQMKVLLLGIYY
jgi:hypothetical protein